MLGLDAFSLPFVINHREQLPTLARLLDEGILSELTSPGSRMSDSVWPTFSTGKQPGDHGQYFPFQWDGDQQRYRRIGDPHWSGDLHIEPFWHRVAQNGHPTIAFDVAHSLNDEDAPCLQITNWCGQSSGDAKSSHPEVLSDIKRRFGRRPIGPEVPVPKTAGQCAAIRDQLIHAVRAKSAATRHLMKRPWTLFVTGWYEAHRAGHNLWPVDGEYASDASPDAMLDVYKEVDRQLGCLLQQIDDEQANISLLLFSLHSMAPNRAQDHFLGEILARLNSVYLGQPVVQSAKPKSLNAMAYLRRALPPTLQYRAASILGERIQDWVVNRALLAGRDWNATPSFHILSGGEGLVRINVKGREVPGYFEAGSEAMADYVAWLIDRLTAITVSETGQPLISRIAKVDEVLPGSRRHFLPDLILDWAPEEPVMAIRSPDIGEIEVQLATGRGGNHNGSAFVIARGDAGLMQSAASCTDIADLAFLAESFLLRDQQPPARRTGDSSALIGNFAVRPGRDSDR